MSALTEQAMWDALYEWRKTGFSIKYVTGQDHLAYIDERKLAFQAGWQAAIRAASPPSNPVGVQSGEWL